MPWRRCWHPPSVTAQPPPHREEAAQFAPNAVVADAHRAPLAPCPMFGPHRFVLRSEHVAGVRDRGLGLSEMFGNAPGAGGDPWSVLDLAGSGGDGAVFVGSDSAGRERGENASEQAEATRWTRGCRGRQDGESGLRVVQDRSLNFLHTEPESAVRTTQTLSHDGPRPAIGGRMTHRSRWAERAHVQPA